MTTHTTATISPAEAGLVDPTPETRVVVFTDVVGSTSLIDLYGDHAWILALTRHLEHTTGMAAEFGGEFMKSTGDGTLVTFEDCADAAAFARAMIESPMGAAARGTDAPRIQLRVGMACGTVYRWNDDYFGRTVHLAARVCAAAEPGEILMSATCLEACSELISGSTGRRPVELRGFSALQQVCAHRRFHATGLGGRSGQAVVESARGLIHAR